jgi:hypothetical protein
VSTVCNEKCSAEVSSSDGWTSRSCSRAATTTRQLRGICAQHARKYDQWGGEGSPRAIAAAKFWWDWQYPKEAVR